MRSRAATLERKTTAATVAPELTPSAEAKPHRRVQREYRCTGFDASLEARARAIRNLIGLDVEGGA